MNVKEAREIIKIMREDSGFMTLSDYTEANGYISALTGTEVKLLLSSIKTALKTGTSHDIEKAIKEFEKQITL